LFAFPPGLLEAGGALLGRGEMVKRLTRSFEIDDRAIRREFGWQPVLSFDAGIAATARWYQGLA
jgi:UDP-glucose 4-epimerase